MPGRTESVFASCSSIAVATSLTGRTMARRALRTPTPSTEQNSSKNSRSTSLRKPISRGVMRPCMGLPSRYSIVCRLICWSIWLCSCRRVNSGMRTSYSKASMRKRKRVLLQGNQLAGDFGDQVQLLRRFILQDNNGTARWPGRRPRRAARAVAARCNSRWIARCTCAFRPGRRR